MVIKEKEIWACAHHLMQRYGDAAALHSAQRADELFEGGDIEGQRTWARILRRIEELESIEPKDGIH